MLLTDGVQSIGAHPVPASSCAPCRTSLPPPALTPAVFRAANLPSRTLAPPSRHFPRYARARPSRTAVGMEKKRLSDLNVHSCAGLKIVVQNFRVRRGIAMLRPENCCILGGSAAFSFRSSFLFRSSFPFRSSSSFRSSFPCAACLRALLSCWRVSRPVCATSEPRAYPTPIAA